MWSLWMVSMQGTTSLHHPLDDHDRDLLLEMHPLLRIQCLFTIFMSQMRRTDLVGTGSMDGIIYTTVISQHPALEHKQESQVKCSIFDRGYL